MRIVSLLPSATETLFALGLDDEIVGVGRECDFPQRANTTRRVVQTRLPESASPAEIDRLVREHIGRGDSLYPVDPELLESLAPDLIVTQDLCHVCAPSPGDLAAALTRFSRRPEVLSLDPHELGDVWRDILAVGKATDRSARAESIVGQIGVRLAEIEREVGAVDKPARVVLLEWLQPLYVGGHWVPEMIGLAGGRDMLGKAKEPSFQVSLEDVIAAAPEVLLIAPCGYTKEKAHDEYLSMTFPKAWNEIPAVREGRVYALDANKYVSRPGPRLVTGIEAIARAIRPSLPVHAGVEAALVKITPLQRGARA